MSGPYLRERVGDVLDERPILVGEVEVMRVLEAIERGAHDGVGAIRIGRLGGERGHPRVDGRRLAQVRLRPREEAREKIAAGRRHLDERLVVEELREILPADVDDERLRRVEIDDVGEVLVGPDAEIDAARARMIEQPRQHGLELGLVRDEVFGREEAVGLGELGDEPPEFAVADRRDPRARRERHPREHERADQARRGTDRSQTQRRQRCLHGMPD